MRFTELAVLLGCHSLEDFPLYHEGPQADQLLAAWCALWHPALLASAGAVPTWHRVDMPPEALSGRLLTVAPAVADRRPAGFAARAAAEGAVLVSQPGRDAAVAAAVAALDGDLSSLDPQLGDDFLALGFCRLQIELLTRQMRYSTHIDETHFQNQAVLGAQAAMEGRADAARGHLLTCLETLYDARKHFYPADVYLMDLTLVAPTTLGDSLDSQFAWGTPSNLLMPIALLESLSRDEPARWSSLLAAIDRGATTIVGDEIEESRLPMLPIEAALESLAGGVRRYEALLGRTPRVYARRRFGLWPGLPQILTRLGYQGAMHFTLDDGRFPLPSQSKTRWEGLDMSVIDIFARVPCDAAKPETFLAFSRHMADAMDNDHVATLAFAHWPGAASPWYADLRRIAELSPVLGKFMLCDEYFSQTDMPCRLSKFTADEYRTPYLMQDIVQRAKDPISSFVREHRQRAERATVEAIVTLADLVSGSVVGEGNAAGRSGSGDLIEAMSRLESTLPRKAVPASASALVINPLSFARRMAVEFPGWQRPPAVGGPVVAAASTPNRHVALVDVPAMGFAWVRPSETDGSPSRAKPLAQDNVLRNEFFEVTISRNTGGIQSVQSFAQRGNLLSQQLAFRLPASHETANSDDGNYTTMRAESVEVTAASTALGEITSRGSLLDAEGRRLGGFKQTTQVWSTSRVIRVDVELTDLEEPRADPWNSYYAARFAWPDESAEMYRGVGWTRQKTELSRLEAPEYIDIALGGGALSILTGGLPYHRRTGSRMLDSLLVVRGETARTFSLGIGVELAHPAVAAIEWMTPSTVRLTDSPSPTTETGWFFHVDAKNVIATAWAPVLDDGDQAEPQGPRRIRGFRARLLETAGRAGRVKLRTFRGVAAARQVDFLGQTLLELRPEGDQLMLDFGAHEWIEVEAIWSS
jgi:alpha-mannosidase